MTATARIAALAVSSILWSVMLAASGEQCSGTTILRQTTDKSFDDVMFELRFAITERNFRITGRNSIGQGLRERGYEKFPNAEVIHFCNLEKAREVLLLDPGFVTQMPCRITVHEEHGKTVISAVMLPEDHRDARVNAFARDMNGLLHEIVDFVIGAP